MLLISVLKTMPSENSTDKAPSNEKPNVPAHPYSEFSDGRRRLVLSIVAVAGFFGPLAAGVYLPALPILVEEFNTSESTINATVSVFMVVLAVAPLFWASRADYAGRKPLYMVSLFIYIVANVLLAAVPANLAALFILRVVQGFGGASVLSLGAGTVADIVAPKNRGAAMSLVLLGPQCGPVLGPILGGAIAGNASWRWIFGFLAIAASVLLLAVIFFLPETLRSIVGTGANYANSPLLIRPKWRQPNVVDPAKFPKPPAPTVLTLLKLLKSPPTVVMSLNGAILFSAYYAMTVTLPYYLENEYHFSPTEVGLACISSGAALVAGSMTSGRVSDYYRSRFSMSADNSPPHHETRLHLQAPGIVLSLSGVLMYGWFLRFHIHVASVIVASAVAAFGMTWVFITTTLYLTESCSRTPATLVALASLFRNPAAAVSTAVIWPLLSRMGVGWCFTGLALVELLCVPATLWIILTTRNKKA